GADAAPAVQHRATREQRGTGGRGGQQAVAAGLRQVRRVAGLVHGRRLLQGGRRLHLGGRLRLLLVLLLVLFLLVTRLVDAGVVTGVVEQTDEVDAVAARVQRQVDGRLDDVAGQDTGRALGTAHRVRATGLGVRGAVLGVRGAGPGVRGAVLGVRGAGRGLLVRR